LAADILVFETVSTDGQPSIRVLETVNTSTETKREHRKESSLVLIEGGVGEKPAGQVTGASRKGGG